MVVLCLQLWSDKCPNRHEMTTIWAFLSAVDSIEFKVSIEIR